MAEVGFADALRPTNYPDITNRKTRYDVSSGVFAGDVFVRLLAMIAGSAVIVALARASIESGNLTGAHAQLVAALAGAVIVGSVVVTRTTPKTAAIIVTALLAGEGFSVLTSTERIVAAREDRASATRGDNHIATLALDRLTKAEVALAKQLEEARATVSKRDCAKECRGLLTAQEAAARQEVIDARTALKNAPGDKSESPLADRLGWEPWVLDLLSAGLLAIGANVLGAALVAWAARPFGTSAGIEHYKVAGAIAERQPPIIEAVENEAEAKLRRVELGIPEPFANDDAPASPKAERAPVSSGAQLVVDLLERNGGTLSGGQRSLAKLAGCSQPRLSGAIREARDAGLVMAETGGAGTILRLVKPAA